MSDDRPTRTEGLSASKRALLEELRRGRPDGPGRTDAVAPAGQAPSSSPSTPAPSIPRRGSGPIPLSFAQQRLWFIHQIDPSSAAYNVPNALRLRGHLRIAELRRSLLAVVERHESLRTRCEILGDAPVQVIDPVTADSAPLVQVDLRDLPPEVRMADAERRAAEEASAPFDLRRGPLWRAQLLRIDDDDHVFLLTLHHIISDGWSMGVLVREIAETYAAFVRGEPSPFGELAIQYADFAVWQRATFAGARLEAELDYWRDRLTPLPPALVLPADRPRPAVQSFRGGVETLSIPAEVAAALRALTRQEGATLFVGLLSAFHALLARITGETDIAVGTGIANRTQPEIEPLIGFFVNALVLRVDCSGDPSVRELVRRTREATFDAFTHQELPFERLVEDLHPERDLSRNPIFQVALALQNAPLDEFELPGLLVSPVTTSTNATRFDLEFHLWETPAGSLDGFLFYSTDLFDSSTVQRFAQRYATLLRAAVENPERRLSMLALATPEDERRLEALQSPTACPRPDDSPLRMFAQRVRERPNAPAIEDGARRLTYAELDRAAEAVAARLCETLARPGTPRITAGPRTAGPGTDGTAASVEPTVGILADRSVEQVVAVLAAAKARMPYVPIDPANPPARVRSMLAQAGTEVVLSTGPNLRHEGIGEVVVVDIAGVPPNARESTDGANRTGTAATGTPGTAHTADALAAPPFDPEALAYIVFTSGSTGEPNGVMVTQSNLAHLVAWHRAAFHLTSDDRTTLIAGVGFDASVWEMWPALASGATLVIAGEDVRLDPPALRDWLIDRRVTVTFLPTPLAERVLALPAWPDRGALRILLTGGDRLQTPDLRGRFFEVVNNYGPTETTVVATSGTVDSGASLALPTIGRAIAGTRAYVLDRRGRAVPPGVPGELFIAGPGVARGYVGRPELTAQRFLPDPSGSGRMYRTGDRVRQLDDGRLEFLGRLDRQVKIRGHRIETAEVERALRTHPHVASATVIAREPEGEIEREVGRHPARHPGPESARDALLVAYVVPQADDEQTAAWDDDHVARWRDLYDQTYDQSHDPDHDLTHGQARETHDPTRGIEDDFNIIGWNSSYTGEPISAAEMREWRDSTVARIRALRPRRVLEIGCGTGLLLSQLAPACERYLGTDLSTVSLGQLRQLAARRPGLAHLELQERRADDFAGLADAAFDTIILNSVIQYFPDQPYLERVLDGALRCLAPGGFLFIGDVRDLRLQRAFARSLAHHELHSRTGPADAHPPGAEADHLDARVSQIMTQEEELLVHPAFFCERIGSRPGARARALVKRGRAHNELTRFRYDVIIATAPHSDTNGISEPDLVEIPWEPAGSPSRWRRHWTQLLGSRMPGTGGLWVIRGIPNRRLQECVTDTDPTEPDLEDWIELAATLGLHAVAGLARDAACFDLTLVRGDTNGSPSGREPAGGLLPIDSPYREDRGAASSDNRDRRTAQPNWTNTPVRVTVAARLVPELRRHLHECLPEYMVPPLFVVLDALPLTPNGKIDLRALPAPPEVTRRPDRWTAPRTRIESMLARIWGDVIGLSRVSIHDHFFEIGGHSLLATQVLSRVRETLGVEISLRSIFESPTLEGLAALIEQSATAGPDTAIPRFDRSARIPLSLAQQRLWFIDRLEPGAAAYLVPNALRLRGRLDEEALSRVLGELIRRHEPLRTRIVEGPDGPEQRIDPPFAFALERIDAAAAAPRDVSTWVRNRVSEEARRPFDLARDPMIRATLFHLADDDHVLALVAHHIATDGWSMGVLVHEIPELYSAFATGRPPALSAPEVQYADWAAWQRDWLHRGELDRQLAYWRAQLAGIEPLELPTDHRRPAHPSYAGDALEIALDAALVRDLRELGASRGATLHMTLLAAFGAVLARWSGQTEFAIGTPVAGRTRREVESLVGFFVNTLALKWRLNDPRAPFARLLDDLRTTALEAYAHQDAPFERIVEDLQPARDTSRNPVFQVLFGLHNVPFGNLDLPGLALESFEFETRTAQFDLELSLFETDAAITGRLHWATDLFERATMERLVRHFAEFLREVVRAPETPVREVGILPAEERARLLGPFAGSGVARAPEPSVLRRFEDQVDRTPDAPALRLDDTVLTYRRLDERANQLARHLESHGVRRGARVGISLPRGIDMVVAVLAARKAGAAFVPLDPHYPPARLRLMVETARLDLLLARERTLGAGPSLGPRLLVLGDEQAQIDRQDAARLARPESPEDLVYVVFTSGSTGQPKGIAMPDRVLRGLLSWQIARSAGHARPGRPTLQYASLSFDVSFQEIFSTFGEGGVLVLVGEDERRDAAQLHRILTDQRIERLFLPFVALQDLAEHLEPDGPGVLPLREVITAGEQLRITPEIRRLFAALPGAVLDNHYGPSETHVATAERLEGAPAPWPDLPSIGRPLPSGHLYVLDAAMQPSPVGVPGEIHLGGELLARGYLDRPDLTADRFVPDPFASGMRLYRTGDRARFLADGRLEFLGRIDRQLKIRGYRIEPGEVESAIAARPGVRSVAVVAVMPDDPAARRLVAFVVVDATLRGNASSLRSTLREDLPEYLVPSRFVEVDALPLGPSGKVDRRALSTLGEITAGPDPAGDSGDMVSWSPLEEIVAEAFRTLLDLTSVRPDSHFFECGGHSLLATRLVARLRHLTGAELPLRAVFDTPSVRDLARLLAQIMSGTPAAVAPALVPASRTSPIPLSFQQERIWFLDRLDPQGTGFVITAGLDLLGPLDPVALETALGTLAARHESLRTRFVTDADGAPRQVIDSVEDAAPGERTDLHRTDPDCAGQHHAVLHRIDLSDHPGAEDELRRHIEAEAHAPFDLEQGPLWRAVLVTMSARRHVLIFAMHHIVTDGWSMAVLVRELGALYGGHGESLPSLPIQYADYAIWQRRWMGGGELERQLAYWRDHLRAVPPLELPTDRPRPARAGTSGFRIQREIPPALSRRLRDLAMAEGATLHMILLAAYGVVLSRWAGTPDFAVGIPVANRTHQETEGLIGYFVNTLAVRLDLSGRETDGLQAPGQPAPGRETAGTGAAGQATTVRQWIARVREATLGAYAHQDLPFESLLEALRPPRDLSRSPVFQVWFNMVNVPEDEPRFGTLQARALGAEALESRFDLSLYAVETDEAIRLDAIARRDIFGTGRISEFLEQTAGVLEQMATHPTRDLDDLTLVTAHARGALPDDRQALSAAWIGSVHERVAEQARRTPTAEAVRDRRTSWTYHELSTRANQLAHALRAHGVGHGDPVAIVAHRGLPLVWAVLGVLRSGGAVLLLDPAHPAPRLCACLEEARPRVLLHLEDAGPLSDALAASARSLGASCLSLPHPSGTMQPPFADLPIEPPHSTVGPDDPACITFTSGSTGRPKGLRGGHGSLTHFQPFLERRFGFGARDRVSMLSGLAHDPLQRDIFTALLCGATVCIPDPEDLDPSRLADWVREQGISQMCLTPAMAKILTGGPAAAPPLRELRNIFMLGERLTRRDVERVRELAPQAAIVNLYGTTETQRASAFFVVAPGQPGDPICGDDGQELAHEAIPAGRGMDDVQLLVRTARGNPAGVGELGELWVRSPHIAPGYLDPALTRTRFTEVHGVRTYRTGDLGRYLCDGKVVVEGRRDGQVNVRGFRVELGEVEAALATHPGVGDAVATVDRRGRLIGYVTAAAAGDPQPREIRAAVRERLPEYMVPSMILRLERLPLTPNAKIDHDALPAPPEDEPETAAAARTPEEEITCAIFADVLERSSVGALDDFFELGGHSLLAVRLLSRTSQIFGPRIPLRDFFESPTPAGLARLCGQATRKGVAPPLRIERGSRDAAAPLSFAQQRLWVLDRLEPGRAAYNLASALRLTGALDIDALGRAVAELERRHEALRTRVANGPDGPVQQIDAPREIIVAYEDLTDPRAATATPGTAGTTGTTGTTGATGTFDPEARAAERLHQEAATPFDLEEGPLFRARLYRTGDTEHLLGFVLHHLVTDGWSMDLLFRELATLYHAFAEGRESPLPEPALQYADWSLWQRTWLRAGELERQLTYWRDALAEVEPLELPTDRPRGTTRGLRGAFLGFELPAADALGLRRTAQSAGATLFHALLACFQGTLARYAATRDVVVGTPIANRSFEQTEEVVGFFANTLALRTRLGAGWTVQDLITQVRDTTLQAHAHQDVPFETIVDALRLERNLARNPLFDVMFVLQHTGAAIPTPATLRVEPVAVDTGATPFDLTLHVAESQGRLFGSIQYDADLFEPDTMSRLARAFECFVHTAASAPGTRLDRLDLRTDDQRTLEARMNAAEAPATEACLHELIERVARDHPDRPALEDKERVFTYGELWERARALAARLRDRGVDCETGVGLLGARNADSIIGMLATWISGGVFVPLDPAQPWERTAAMLRDAHVAVLLQDRSLQGLVPEGAPPVVYLDDYGRGDHSGDRRPPGRDEPERTQSARRPDDRARNGHHDDARTSPANAAYVIFTSGSTGEPKGSVVEHRAITPRALAMVDEGNITREDRVLHTLPLVFDGSLYEILPALLAGATLIVHPDPRGETAGDLLTRFERLRITVADLPVGLLHEVADEVARTGRRLSPTLRLLLTGGESPAAARLESLLRAGSPDLRITNAYGPTEAVIIASTERFAAQDLPLRHVAIGTPVRHSTLHVLDGSLAPVPLGGLGELYIGGPLGRGYANLPGPTAAAFVPDPFSETPGARLYRTGDLARRLPDGRLLFVGRRDAQVKLRGFRIELGEVEAALHRLPEVREAAVFVQGAGARAYLAACVALETGIAVDPQELRQSVRRHLPEYMVPASIVVCDALPKNRNDKIDRRALPALEIAARRRPAGHDTPADAGANAAADATTGGAASGIAPRDALEQALARIWTETLDLETPVDVEEGFFEAGGNSLLAIRFVGEVRNRLDIDLPVAAIFREPTLAGLARIIRGAPPQGARLVRLRAGNRPDLAPLICLPAAGGGISDFAEMAAHFDPRRTVYAIPIVDSAVTGGLPADIAAAADACLRAILDTVADGPLHVLGWSYGGLIAYEIARRLAQAGREPGVTFLIDVAAPDGRAPLGQDVGAWPLDPTPRTAGPAALEALRVTSPLPVELATADAEAWMAGLQARIAAAQQYRPEPHEGAIVLVRGTESITGRDRDAHLGWEPWVRGPLTLEWTPGTHDSLLRGDGARGLAAIVERQLATPEQTRPTGRPSTDAPIT